MRVLIIGLGSIARKHIDALRILKPQVKFFALRSSRNVSVVENVQNLYSYEEIPNLKPDFIIISNPTGEHFHTIKKVARYNIPLFIEKPVFANISTKAEQLVSKIKQNRIQTYIACNLRFLDCLKNIKKIIAGKRINEVNIYCGSYLPDWRKGVDYRKTYSANMELGGGVHIDLIHELDYTYWLFGKPVSTSSTFTNKSSLQISSFDYANYLWHYESFSTSIVLNYYRRDAKRILEIVTNEETYLVDLLNNTIYRNNDVVYESKQTTIDTYYNQMFFFINNILRQKEQFNTIEEAYYVLKLCMKD